MPQGGTKVGEQNFIVHFIVDTCCKALRAGRRMESSNRSARPAEAADSWPKLHNPMPARMAEGLLKSLRPCALKMCPPRLEDGIRFTLQGLQSINRVSSRWLFALANHS